VALEQLLAEQIAYYDALSGEYADHALRLPGGEELEAALERFRPAGEVLEIACGPGTWPAQLLAHASNVTALDASRPNARPRPAAPPDARLRLIEAGMFSWHPERRYDVVFCGFWLSHVPPERVGSFWSLVEHSLRPRGRVFFVDDAHRSPEELIGEESGYAMRRRLNDGSCHRAVKVARTPAALEPQLRQLGWHSPSTRPRVRSIGVTAGARNRPARQPARSFAASPAQPRRARSCASSPGSIE
jgi:demethylmenaquinone methyltransferase/2-methoxy-6-polyprenyl-1,4-benzoquinol methylase